MPTNVVNPVELAAIVMLFLSFYGLMVARNIIKSIICISLMEVAVVMVWLSIGFRVGQTPPIMASIGGHEAIDTIGIAYIADPLPQALMITAIVIGLAVTAVNTIMFITLYRRYRSVDWDMIKLKSLED